MSILKTRPSQYACWLEGSLFVKDEAFNFFELCFENALADFDYFAFSKATPPEVKSLEAELSAFLNPIEEGGERELLFSRLVPHYPRGGWDGVGTEVLREKILLCGKAIEAYVRNTRAKGTILHVLGM